jgi:hypothetical protein
LKFSWANTLGKMILFACKTITKEPKNTIEG